MTYKTKLQFLIVLCYSVNLASFAQISQEGFEKLSAKLDSHSPNNPKELIYLQTSKGIYETGEDLWFKAYVLDAQYLIPSKSSQTLYLQLLSMKTREPIWQEKYEIIGGFAHGHVYIDNELLEGEYLLAACTEHSLLRNRSDFKAIRKIVVIKNLKPRITLSTQFKKQSFTSGESIAVSISCLNEQQKPKYVEIVVTLLKGEKMLEVLKGQTENPGGSDFHFSPIHTTKGLKLKIEAKHSNGTENIVVPVPFHKDISVQFGLYPEGGMLISGIKSKVAFKAVNHEGFPEDVRGILFDNKDTLLNFASTHNGMGSFNFIPKSGNKYSVKLTSPEIDSIFSMPEISPKGINLQLTKRDSSFLSFKVKQIQGMAQKRIYLRGQSRGVVYCMASGILRDELEINIPLNQFPLQGIAEFTLFDTELQPLAERLVYVHPENKLNIDVQLDKRKYASRDKVRIELKVTNRSGQPVMANLGATVFDKIYRNNNDPKNILTHYHLFTQLKGKVFDPAFYFNEKNSKRHQALDLLLLTQGWRNYIWSETALKARENNRQAVIKDGTKGQLFATKKQKKAPIAGQFIIAHNPGENDGIDLLETKAGGEFIVLPAHFNKWQGGYIYLKPMGNEDFGYKLKLSDPFDRINKALEQTQLSYPEYNQAHEMQQPVRDFIPGTHTIELDEVIITGKTKVQFRDKYLGHLDSLAKLELCTDYVCPSGTLNCPQHDVDRSKKPIEGEVYYYMTGFKWNNNRDAYTITGSGHITYHYPEISEEELLKMHNLSRVKAYYTEREFYQPNYDIKEERRSLIPDYRNTLLWEAVIITDENGEATIEFFCSDIITEFTGIIEGVDGSGQLGHTEFEVVSW